MYYHELRTVTKKIIGFIEIWIMDDRLSATAGIWAIFLGTSALAIFGMGLGDAVIAGLQEVSSHPFSYFSDMTYCVHTSIF
jgi:hypothetical protein